MADENEIIEVDGIHQDDEGGSEREMPLWEHLEELRRRVVICGIALAVCTVGGFLVSAQLLHLLSKPIGTLYFFGPQEALFIRMKLALATGLAVSFPVILYQIWAFVGPGLTRRERGYIVPTVFASTALFLAGVAFAYFVVLPIGIRVLLSFATADLKDLIGVSKYFTFVIWFLLAFGILFQTPVVILVLTWLGVVTPKGLLARWRHAVLIVFVVAAVITPSVDLVSQVLLAAPLIVLYFASILVSLMVRRRRAAAD
jgi:sec-independent protein translocase protein TatC